MHVRLYESCYLTHLELRLFADNLSAIEITK